ncbi:MAG: ATP synthase F1 subunit gamma [Lachnospiraceae bacterium]|nr:ATP synthase F1 subunit gamma [Lachnospiraceae bacterium]
MANIREISGRIRSIRDTMKITNAMYMISSTKLRKAKKGQEGNSPYFEALNRMYAKIIESTSELDNVYLDERPEKKGEDRTIALIVVTADKGLAGSYNHNVIKLAEQIMKECGCNTKLYVVGEVGRQAFAGKQVRMSGQFKYSAQNPSLHRARLISEVILDKYLKGEIDEAHIVFTKMKNTISSEAVAMRVLPLMYESLEPAFLKEGEMIPEKPTINFMPSAEDVLNNIVPDMVVGDVYSALVESFCSEQNDRMMAMDTANKNAAEMIRALSIEYNRERQAMITQEITEVIAGAKAQKKKKAKRKLAALEDM